MYNISYDIVGVILCIVLLMLHSFIFDKEQKSNKLFKKFVISALAEGILDIVTAWMIDGLFSLPDIYSNILNCIYTYVALQTAYFAFRMIGERMEFFNKYIYGFAYLCYGVGSIIVLSNVFTNFLFTFNNGIYERTPFYTLVYAFSIALLGIIPIIFVFERNKLKEGEALAPLYFLGIILINFLIQLFLPKVLLNSFGKAVSGVVYCLMMETPEHVKVRLTAESLQNARKKELKTIENLSKANEDRTNFLVNMTHELRTPINAILGFTEIFVKENDTDEIIGSIEKIRKSGSHLIDLVDDMVDFSQIDTGDFEIDPREYEITEAFLLFKDVMEKHEASYSESINRTIESNMPQRLYGDVRRVAQACEKMCMFLEKHSINGMMLLSVALDRIEDNMAYIDIVVKNSNVNIEEYELLKDTDIILARKIVESLGSELKTEPLEAGAYSFSFVLKQEIVDTKEIGNLENALTEYANRSVRSYDPESFAIPTATILVVDDTAINLRVVEGLIRPFKAKVICANSGPKALEYMKKYEIDFVFMDILMPDMDGVETLEHIRNDEGILSKEVPVVALTANVFAGAHDYYISKGFGDYITKPVSGDRIAETFKTFLPHKIETNWLKFDVTEAEE